MNNQYDRETLETIRNYYNSLLPEKFVIQDAHFNKMVLSKEKNSPMKYFDWEALFHIIEEYNPKKIMIGLQEDWTATSDTIYEEGTWNPWASYFVVSLWDTPVIRLYDKKGNETIIPCFTESRKFPEETYEGAINIVVEHYETYY